MTAGDRRPGRQLEAMIGARPAFSWRSDDSFPPFPDDRPVIVFDGVCLLSSGVVRFVAQRDPGGAFLFAAAQSPLDQGLYRQLGLDPVNFESNLLVLDGRVLGNMEAFSAIAGLLGWPWRMLAAGRRLPAQMSEWIYDRIAKNRYRLLGRRETCVVPDASWRTCVIE